MTLDRIDNKIGHMMDNVNTSCSRCNYIRKDMPYDAWLFVVKSVREAAELGLFGNWEGQNNKPFHKRVLDIKLN